MPKDSMKLYVWQVALVEYRAGLAVAMARTPDEAKRLLIQRGLPEHYFCGYGIQTEDDIVYPIVHDHPAATFVFG
jgi:hypothetical protein